MKGRVQSVWSPKSEVFLNKFQRTRQDHSRELNEDYVELIQDLIQEHGEARITDIAIRLNVTTVTVSKRIRKLADGGLVVAEKYRSVQLTELGREIAIRSRERHELVLAFLVSLGVSPEVAEADAEGIEHHCSEETLIAMTRIARKAQS